MIAQLLFGTLPEPCREIYKSFENATCCENASSQTCSDIQQKYEAQHCCGQDATTRIGGLDVTTRNGRVEELAPEDTCVLKYMLDHVDPPMRSGYSWFNSRNTEATRKYLLYSGQEHPLARIVAPDGTYVGVGLPSTPPEGVPVVVGDTTHYDYCYDLTPGLRWSDGAPVVAEDFTYVSTHLQKYYVDNEGNVPDYVGDWVPTLSGTIRVENDYRFCERVSAVIGTIYMQASYQYWSVVPSHYFKQCEADGLSQGKTIKQAVQDCSFVDAPAGGPYKIKAYAHDYIEYEANPMWAMNIQLMQDQTYHASQLMRLGYVTDAASQGAASSYTFGSNLRGVKYVFGTTEEKYAALEAGDVDFVGSFDAPPANFTAPPGTQYVTSDSGSLVQIHFIGAKPGNDDGQSSLSSNTKWRQAIAMLIDHDEMLEYVAEQSARGGLKKVESVFDLSIGQGLDVTKLDIKSVGTPGLTREQRNTRALQLISEAGLDVSTMKTQVVYTSTDVMDRNHATRYVVDKMEAIGIRVRLEEVSSRYEYYPVIDRARGTLETATEQLAWAIIGWGDMSDPVTSMITFANTFDGFSGLYYWDNAAYEAALVRARSANMAEFEEILVEMSGYLADEAAVIALYNYENKETFSSRVTLPYTESITGLNTFKSDLNAIARLTDCAPLTPSPPPPPKPPPSPDNVFLASCSDNPVVLNGLGAYAAYETCEAYLAVLRPQYGNVCSETMQKQVDDWESAAGVTTTIPTGFSGTSLVRDVCPVACFKDEPAVVNGLGAYAAYETCEAYLAVLRPQYGNVCAETMQRQVDDWKSAADVTVTIPTGFSGTSLVRDVCPEACFKDEPVVLGDLGAYAAYETCEAYLAVLEPQYGNVCPETMQKQVDEWESAAGVTTTIPTGFTGTSLVRDVCPQSCCGK